MATVVNTATSAREHQHELDDPVASLAVCKRRERALWISAFERLIIEPPFPLLVHAPAGESLAASSDARDLDC